MYPIEFQTQSPLLRVQSLDFCVYKVKDMYLDVIESFVVRSVEMSRHFVFSGS